VLLLALAAMLKQILAALAASELRSGSSSFQTPFEFRSKQPELKGKNPRDHADKKPAPAISAGPIHPHRALEMDLCSPTAKPTISKPPLSLFAPLIRLICGKNK
jgi:hypothetical protein